MDLSRKRPSPPSLREGKDAADYDDAEVSGTDEYHRAELRSYLEDGAWEEAWDRWADHTDLSEAEFSVIEELDLLEDFDFFWDDFANRVGYHAPGIPEDWKHREYHDQLTSWEQVSNINASLTELGQIVSDVLKDDYVEWEAEFDAPDDLPDFNTS